MAERTWAALQRARAEKASRESEERFRLAIEIGELASWDWDLRSGQVTWNDRHFLMQGLLPAMRRYRLPSSSMFRLCLSGKYSDWSGLRLPVSPHS